MSEEFIVMCILSLVILAFCFSISLAKGISLLLILVKKLLILLTFSFVFLFHIIDFWFYMIIFYFFTFTFVELSSPFLSILFHFGNFNYWSPPPNVCFKSIYFPLGTVLAVSHKFWYAVSHYHLVQNIFWFF